MPATPASRRTPQMSWELLFQITDLLRVLGAPGNTLNNKKITLGTIDSLVEDGIVQREQSSEDRRAIHISLTKQGIALKRRHDNYFTDYMDHFFRNIDEKKQQIFLEVLEQMVETLQPEVEEQAAEFEKED